MMGRRLQAIVAFVIVVAVVQIALEDLIVFLGATSTGGPAALPARYLLLSIPLTLMTVLFVVLVGSAILSSDPFR